MLFQKQPQVRLSSLKMIQINLAFTGIIMEEAFVHCTLKSRGQQTRAWGNTNIKRCFLLMSVKNEFGFDRLRTSLPKQHICTTAFKTLISPCENHEWQDRSTQSFNNWPNSRTAQKSRGTSCSGFTCRSCFQTVAHGDTVNSLSLTNRSLIKKALKM